MNFGSPNLTKQKKKPRNTTKCHTKKNPRNTTKCHNIFTIILFPAMVGLSLILLFYFLRPQYFHNKSQVKNYYWFQNYALKQTNEKTTQENCL